MTYLQFHLVFILPVLFLLWKTQPPQTRETIGKPYLYLGLVCLIAFVWTTPWDNYLIYRGVWASPDDRIIGTIGYVPIEEYLFFLLQPILTGLFFFRCYTLRPMERPTQTAPNSVRWLGVGFFMALALWGVWLLNFDWGTYLGLILVWAMPVFAGMWALVGKAIWEIRKTFTLALWLPTLYLWAADRFAIWQQIWEISPTYTTGYHILGLPIEEAAFFLVTNLLCMGGLSIFMRLWELQPQTHSIKSNTLPSTK